MSGKVIAVILGNTGIERHGTRLSMKPVSHTHYAFGTRGSVMGLWQSVFPAWKVQELITEWLSVQG